MPASIRSLSDVAVTVMLREVGDIGRAISVILFGVVLYALFSSGSIAILVLALGYCVGLALILDEDEWFEP